MSEAFLGAFLGAVLATLAADGLRNWKAALMEHKRDCRKQMKYYNKLMNESGDVGQICRLVDSHSPYRVGKGG
jgi:hypothetical protein